VTQTESGAFCFVPRRTVEWDTKPTPTMFSVSPEEDRGGTASTVGEGEGGEEEGGVELRTRGEK
jgi:hypothetical protein